MEGHWLKHVNPRSAFIASLLVGLLIWAIAALVTYRNAHEARLEHARRWSASGDVICVHAPPDGALICTVASTPSGANNPYIEYDLRAQQEMAEWAFAVFLATLASIVVTLVGLIYVVRAYRLNAAATDHARVAAEAAVAQTKTAQDALAAERRPWVAVEDVRLVALKYDAINGALNFTVLISMRNTGHSPALNVHLSVGCTGDLDPSAPKRLQDDLRAREKSAPPISILADTLFPGSAARQQQWTVSISRGDFVKLLKAWRATFPDEAPKFLFLLPSVFGVVAYRSPHDAEVHTTGFCVTYMQDQGAFRFNPDNPDDLPDMSRLIGKTMFGGWDAD